MEKINVIYVRFDKNLDYKQVVNSYPIHKILESTFGDTPNMVSPKKYTFSREKLGEFIQDQYSKSKEYVVDETILPSHIITDYFKNVGVIEDFTSRKLVLKDWESEILLDDHLVTVNFGDIVLGVFATEYDFEHIIDELKDE